MPHSPSGTAVRIHVVVCDARERIAGRVCTAISPVIPHAGSRVARGSAHVVGVLWRKVSGFAGCVASENAPGMKGQAATCGKTRCSSVQAA